MLLYHGTSEQRLKSILAQDCLKVSDSSHTVSLTTPIVPANYWAKMSAQSDRSEPYVLCLDACS